MFVSHEISTRAAVSNDMVNITKIIKHTGNLFRKKLQLKGVC